MLNYFERDLEMTEKMITNELVKKINGSMIEKINIDENLIEKIGIQLPLDVDKSKILEKLKSNEYKIILNIKVLLK